MQCNVCSWDNTKQRCQKRFMLCSYFNTHIFTRSFAHDSRGACAIKSLKSPSLFYYSAVISRIVNTQTHQTNCTYTYTCTYIYRKLLNMSESHTNNMLLWPEAILLAHSFAHCLGAHFRIYAYMYSIRACLCVHICMYDIFKIRNDHFYRNRPSRMGLFIHTNI